MIEPMDILINLLKRHPQLSCLHVQTYYTTPHPMKSTISRTSHTEHAEIGTIISPLTNEHLTADIMVNTTFGDEIIEIILKAMTCGVPVLIPDIPHHGATFVRDGINGFLNRDQDPDSLELSLLMLAFVSRNILQHVIAEARETTLGMGGGNPSRHIAINRGRT